jgi:lysylphosphatidylglycerol synthetase-like protein (DUF2156 family)
MTFLVSRTPLGLSESRRRSGRPGGRAAWRLAPMREWLGRDRRHKLDVVVGDLGRAELALAGADVCNTAVSAALMGDKRILFSASGRSFISYGVRGRSWLALAGPVGLASEMDEVMGAFLAAARAARAKPAFYAVSPAFAPLARRHHLRLLKSGERALLDLTTFSMAGKERQVSRTHRNRHMKAGFSVVVEPPGSARAHQAVLARLSNEWLADTEGKEKSFALGHFDIAYLDRLPLATVRGPDGTISAFASLWPTADRSRIGVDLMRYGHDATNGVMDYLFAELFLWAQGEGYRQFDLNTAPFSGVEPSPDAPVTTTLARIAYEHGEKFYNFKGVRRFKKKFHPEWEDVFLATPRGVSPLSALATAAILINRSV